MCRAPDGRPTTSDEHGCGIMSRVITTLIASRLEKVAFGNGFDLEAPRPPREEGEWLAFGSTHCPLRIWLGVDGETEFHAAFSRQNAVRALAEHGVLLEVDLPRGAFGGRTMVGLPALHRLLRRALQLSKALPDELLHAFQRATRTLPLCTEAERMVVQRVGQDLFRSGLLEYRDSRCAVTGLAVPDLLRASHIKPWADCADDAERLDVHNGFLLAPHLDAAFDRGFITVDDNGRVVVSDAINEESRRLLRLNDPLTVRGLNDGHRGYLVWHRDRIFRKGAGTRSEVED